MKSFKELNENSFYQTAAEKDKFVNNEKLVINAFMFSFVGMIGLLDGAKDNTKVKVYFRSDQKLRIDNITDENNDVSLIIKIMKDQGFFKNATTPNQITRFLAKAKMGQVDNVDADIVRGWLEDIKPDKMKGLSAVVRRLTKEFVDGGSLATLTDSLKSNAKVTRWKTSEFGQTAKVVKIDPAKKKAGPKTTTSAKASTDPKSTAVKAAPKVANKSVGDLSRKGDRAELFDAIKKGTDPATLYKKPTQKELGTAALDFWIQLNDLTPTEIKNFIEYFKNNKFSSAEFKETFFLLRSRGSLSLKHKKFFENGGLNFLRLVEYNKKQSQYIASLIRSLFSDWITFPDRDWIAQSKDETYQNLAKFIINANLISRWDWLLGIYVEYVANGKKAALEKASKLGYFPFKITKKDGGYSYSPIESRIDDNTPLIANFLEFLGAEKQSYLEKEVDEFVNQSKGFPDRELSTDEVKEFTDLVNSFLSDAPQPSYFVMNMFSKAKTVKKDWQINILIEALNRVSIDEILELEASGRAYRKYIDFETISQYPSALVDNLVERIIERVKGEWSQHFLAILELLDKKPNSTLESLLAKKYSLAVLDLIPKVKSMRDNDDYSSFYRNPLTILPRDKSKFRDFLNNKYKSFQDEIDTATLQYHLGKTARDSSIIQYFANMFGNMSPANQKMVLGVINNPDPDIRRVYYEVVSKITDSDLVAKIDPKKWLESGNKLLTLHDESRLPTPELINKILKSGDKTLTQSLDDEISYTRSYGQKNLIPILAESDMDEVQFSKIVDDSIRKIVNDGDERWIMPGILAKSNNKETFTKKDKILFEKLVKHADENIPKLRKEYQEIMTSAQPAFVKYAQTDRNGASAFYDSMTKSMKKRMAAAYLSNGEFAATAGAALMDDKNPIKPNGKLDAKRIRDILKYNNVVSEETKISDRYTKSLDALDLYIKEQNPADAKKLEDLQIEVIEKTPKQLAQLSADLHRNKRNNRHGNVSMVIKREFNVSIPLQVKEQKEWIENDPGQEIINPMYHGTGSIAASMILRYGFRVIKSGDASVVGRMLGDGVYGAIHLDKSQQYVGDSGYGRRPGLKGYIFEINAALGKQGQDYRVAGLGGDRIRSPEWCVFTPNAQFKIVKAYEIELVSEGTMSKILTENPPTKNVRESKRYTSFRNYLKETVTMSEEYPNYTTYTFVNGLIPIARDNYVDFEEFKPKGKVTLEPSAYGPSVVVEGTEESNSYIFTSPSDFAESEPELFEAYLEQISK